MFCESAAVLLAVEGVRVISNASLPPHCNSQTTSASGSLTGIKRGFLPPFSIHDIDGGGGGH